MNLKFSHIEKQHLLKAWVAISIAFGILMSTAANFIVVFFISLFTVGLGFMVHEIAHKYFAQKFHCQAEFRANEQMLLLAIAMSFFGFIFIAPGAVIIRGRLTTKLNGIVSLAGPLSNLVLALLFFSTHLLFPNPISLLGATINTWLGLFNMIPFPIFDGAKVYKWSKSMYFATIVLGGLLMVIIQ